MPNDDLTFVQRCALITLMAENREVPNAELEKVFRLKLEKGQRDVLRKAGYITVRQEKEGRPAFLELTDDGWGRAAAEFGLATPERPGAGGAALYRVLAKLKIYLDSINRAPADVFGVTNKESPAVESPVVEVAAATEDLEALIRNAYGAIATRSGDYVMLSDLRPRLGDASKADVDAALKRLNRAPDVSLVPESDQKKLGPVERAAAVNVGNQNKHLISIGS